jgi:hypothetical protein
MAQKQEETQGADRPYLGPEFLHLLKKYFVRYSVGKSE